MSALRRFTSGIEWASLMIKGISDRTKITFLQERLVVSMSFYWTIVEIKFRMRNSYLLVKSKKSLSFHPLTRCLPSFLGIGQLCTSKNPRIYTSAHQLVNHRKSRPTICLMLFFLTKFTITFYGWCIFSVAFRCQSIGGNSFGNQIINRSLCSFL